jgi:hypothetical protein
MPFNGVKTAGFMGEVQEPADSAYSALQTSCVSGDVRGGRGGKEMMTALTLIFRFTN